MGRVESYRTIKILSDLTNRKNTKEKFGASKVYVRDRLGERETFPNPLICIGVPLATWTIL